jgi:hypothetical protein
MIKGWVFIHKRIRKWGWYKHGPTVQVFLELLLTANYEPSEYMGHTIERGQAVCGRKTMAITTGLTQDQVRTALKHLKSTNEITIKSTNRFSIVTICNYNKFQDWEKFGTQLNPQPNPQQIPNKSPADPQQIPTSKEVNKQIIKEDNNLLPAKASHKKKTLFDLKTSISHEQYQELMSRQDMAAGDREYLRDQVESMADWSSGKGERRVDWAACLRNWIKRNRKSGDMPNGVIKKGGPQTFTEREEDWAKEQARRFMERTS